MKMIRAGIYICALLSLPIYCRAQNEILGKLDLPPKEASQQPGRHLTPDQKNQLAAVLSPGAGQLIEVVCDRRSRDACSFAQDFIDVLNNAHWKQSNSPQITLRTMIESRKPAVEGVRLAISDEDGRNGITPHARLFHNALVSLDIPMTYSVDPAISSGGMRVTFGVK